MIESTKFGLREEPLEIWALMAQHGLVCAMDDDEVDNILCWRSEDDAEMGMKHQIEMGYFDADEVEIVRIK